MATNNMQDQAVQITGAMADRLARRTAGLHWGSTGRGMVAGRQSGQEQAGVDFEKALNRLDRPWMERCMAAVGSGAGAQQWVSLLHAGTTARVAFNGWHLEASQSSRGSSRAALCRLCCSSDNPACGRACKPVGSTAGAACPQHAIETASALCDLFCVAGGLEFGPGLIHGSVSVRGHRPASGVRLVRVPPIQTCDRTPGAKRV